MGGCALGGSGGGGDARVKSQHGYIKAGEAGCLANGVMSVPFPVQQFSKGNMCLLILNRTNFLIFYLHVKCCTSF